MSLTIASGPGSRTVRYWLAGLWPFWLFLLAALTAIRYLIAYWPLILLKSVVWQEQLHQHLAQLLYQVQQDPGRAGLSLLLFSLVYGILHAVGPGHGKVVLTTYLATHPSRLKLSMAMTLAASLLQGGMAIALVSVVLVGLHLSSRVLHLGEFWLEKSSYILIALLGALLCRRALLKLRDIIRNFRHRGQRPLGAITSLRYLGNEPPKDGRPYRAGPGFAPPGKGQRAVLLLTPLAPIDGRYHPAGCACGHHHLPDESALQADAGWRTRVAVVLAMGFRPCSGAVLVLLFAKVIGVYGWGVISALVMAAGTSLTLLTLALLVFFSRRVAESLTRRHTSGISAGVAWATLSLAGGLLLVAAGAVLYLTAQPLLMGTVRPFSH
ncbi:nickel/cobalt transporter [Sodalis ligni]|jgi:nickel/cobalt exporter|uniref:Nickel/cobalt efflux system n=1 Tax=Sodalis ligni TaxID=2697027 RepID=A0A4R1NLT5_9GAMM|nr:nickel/cobalt transporter [Sodalis ligni]TCL06941.1 ABC-type nickel/cobalt efflux system permease component RcnA [Sodalis ligni]